MDTVRAILIDPEKRSFTEVQLVRGDDDCLAEICRVLKCQSITEGGLLSGSLSKGFDSILTSDDDLEGRGGGTRFWFQVDATNNPPASFPIAGLGLACGADSEGAMCDVRISVADLAQRITFTQRVFRGFTTEETRDGVINIAPIAPIIDS